MENLKERKLQLESLITSLQYELDLVNKKLEAENQNIEVSEVKTESTFDFENKEDTETVRAVMIEAIIENVSYSANIDLKAIEKRYIDSTRDENGMTSFHNFTLEQEVLVNKKWIFTGHGFLKQIKFENAQLKETKKALYLYESNGNTRYLLKDK